VAVNEWFPHDLAAVAGESEARVIHLSTDGVFSGNAGVCREDSPTDCNDVYGKSKRGGEVTAPCVINLRCSVVGPDPVEKKGLLEWFRSQPRGAEVPGYLDHEWNGVTTLQFSELCRDLILRDSFAAVRSEASVHHFCPNQAVSKYELLQLFESGDKTGVKIKPFAGARGPSSRLLDNKYARLKEFYGYGRSKRRAVEELAAWETKNRDPERF
jgi:dTDP-4-dehydrorhamnose reductase